MEDIEKIIEEEIKKAKEKAAELDLKEEAVKAFEESKERAERLDETGEKKAEKSEREKKQHWNY